MIKKGSTPVKRTFDLLDRYKNEYNSKDIALGGMNGKSWYTYSASDYVEKVESVALGLLALGVQVGDKVATVTHNRPEWNFFDLGLAMIGAVHVPVYPTISSEEYQYILNNAEVRFVVVGEKKLLKKISDIQSDLPNLEEVFTFDPIKGSRDWKVIEKLGLENKQLIGELTSRKDDISEKDLATLIYTSGTTGVPKGVMLSHENLVSNFTTHVYNHELNDSHRCVSFLPLCHVYERSLNYHFQYCGMSIYYIPSLGAILPALQYVKPHMFNTVPRLLERIYDGIMKKGNDLPYFSRRIFQWSVRLGSRFEFGKRYSFIFKIRRAIADKLVYSKWRDVMGGEIQIIISGGAALQPRISRILGIAKINALEGYGLTETSPVIAVSNYATGKIKYGTVGPAMPNMDVRIADDGEIICKGPGVMMGYYKAPELTKEVIDDEGYFHTGDIGVFEEGTYLKITDRKKEIFKMSGGKYIAPQMIENKMKESLFIEQAIVVGENQKFASALIAPDFNYLKSWCEEQKIQLSTPDEIINSEAVYAAIYKDISIINRELGQVEQIKRFKLIADSWTPDNGSLSPTLKLKRKYLTNKYQSLIDDIFSTSNQISDSEALEKRLKSKGQKFKVKKFNFNALINRLKFN